MNWPEKNMSCGHQSVNPNQLCQACKEVNDTIDTCKLAYAKDRERVLEKLSVEKIAEVIPFRATAIHNLIKEALE